MTMTIAELFDQGTKVKLEVPAELLTEMADWAYIHLKGEWNIGCCGISFFEYEHEATLFALRWVK